MTRLSSCFLLLLSALALPLPTIQAADRSSPGRQGYYRFPTLHGEEVVFTAEGDLWKVNVRGGMAARLTSHPGEETHAAYSSDGKTLAFSAQYEGPTEVYTMPAAGGLPHRLTYEGEQALVQGWTPDGEVLYATPHFSTLPDWQLASVDPKSGLTMPLPLSQASEGVWDPNHHTLFFTRQAFQGSSTKRYQGGTVQNLWKFAPDTDEATPLTADFAGTSKSPMLWRGRIYFLSDRDGTMNLWSMDEEGGDLREQTVHRGWDIQGASLDQGRIVYQIGADLRLYDIAARSDLKIPITLASDFDQEREKWVQKPMDYVTSAHLSPDGDRLVLTARGQIFVAPAKYGRLVHATRQQRVRYRQARFMPDGQSVLALSDQTGELEFNQLPANGVGEPKPLSHDGKVFRFDGVPSPDGKWVAYQDKNQELWLLDVDAQESRRIATSKVDNFQDLRWSPDSRWLAYVAAADNQYARIFLYHLTDSGTTPLTSDRVDSFSPAWSPDGQWLYFLSARHLHSEVASPWGPREPEPFFNEAVKIYEVSLRKEGRSPFAHPDELHPEKKKDEKKSESSAGSKDSKGDKASDKTKNESERAGSKSSSTNRPPPVRIDLEGLRERTTTVPVGASNYRDLAVDDKYVYWLQRGVGSSEKLKLTRLEISEDDPKPKDLVEDFKSYELSHDGKKVLIWRKDQFYVVDANASAPLKLEKEVDLKNWTFSLTPREEWREMFVESWRLMRDYFYDPKMNGVDWAAMRDKYLPLTDRVTERAELSDLIADMVGELSALHIFVRGGDFRKGPDSVELSALGAALSRDETQGGYRVRHIYRADPDYPERLSPLVKPGVDLAEGAIIQKINGVPVLSVENPGALLRNQAGRQVLLHVKPSESEAPRDVVVTPISLARQADLRYDDWEYSRRLEVETLGAGEIGYVHLRAMGANDIAAWAREFYPVFNRQGLIIDVRHNRGGNIDSWILEKLLRQAWFFWQPRVGSPTWNMPYAFRGHVVVLCDEHTASDGEAFTEGFKRLRLGKVIGTRTWGGEIWLAMDNWLQDKGIASAAEIGVYGPEGKWLIEGHGVDPDVVVDNLPHATFQGKDAQLRAAIAELKEEIRRQPVTVPRTPGYPDRSFKLPNH